jgi:hypothetical protein
MYLRRLTAALSMVLMGHLLVAQSLLACGLADQSGAHGSAAVGHCHETKATTRPTGDPSGGPHLTESSSDHALAPPPCCTVAMSCSSASFVAMTDKAELAAVDHAILAANSPIGVRRGTSGPEPPPPRQLAA